MSPVTRQLRFIQYQEKTEMHRALLIQDTVHQILENLSPRNLTNPIPKLTRATLLSVALTCRSFLDPALDSLWYSIDDLEVLFKLLPNFISEPGSDWYRPVRSQEIYFFHLIIHFPYSLALSGAASLKLMFTLSMPTLFVFEVIFKQGRQKFTYPHFMTS